MRPQSVAKDIESPSSPGMGGPTYIHQATQLFEPAGTSHEAQAKIAPMDTWIYRIGLQCSQKTVDENSVLLISRLKNVWFATAAEERFCLVPADDCWFVPAIRVSSAFKGVFASRQDKLDFIYVVQGRNAGRSAKIGVAHTYREASTSMMHELLNGYSITFSAAILKTASAVLFDEAGPVAHDLTFRKVDVKPSFGKDEDDGEIPSLSELTQWSEDGQTLMSVGVLC